MKTDLRLLKKQLQEETHPLFKAQKANELSRAYLYRDLDQVEAFARLAMDLACQSNRDEYLRATINLGASHLLRQDFDTGLDYYYKVYTSSQSPKLLVRCYMAIGVCYSKLAFYEEALAFEEKALDLSLKANNNSATAAIFNNIATIYMNQGAHDLSEQYFSKALTLASKHHYTNIQAYLLVGLLNNDLRRQKYDHMEDYFNQIETLIDAQNEMWFIGITQCLKACYHIAYDNMELAMVYFDIGIDILEDEDQYMYLVLAYDELILSLDRAGYQRKALDYLNIYEDKITHKNLKMGKGLFLKTAMDYYANHQSIKLYHHYQKSFTDYTTHYSYVLEKFKKK